MFVATVTGYSATKSPLSLLRLFVRGSRNWNDQCNPEAYYDRPPAIIARSIYPDVFIPPVIKASTFLQEDLRRLRRFPPWLRHVRRIAGDPRALKKKYRLSLSKYASWAKFPPNREILRIQEIQASERASHGREIIQFANRSSVFTLARRDSRKS